MVKVRKRAISIHIDEWTNSIIEVSTGKSFKTSFCQITDENSKQIIARDWFFKWKEELKLTDRQVYKMYADEKPKIIQGLISLSLEKGYIEVHKVENPKWNNPKFNKGNQQLYRGVGPNLFAFACKLSKENGFDGFIGFFAKTPLINHYKETLGAHVIHGQRMAINNIASDKLIKFYFQ
jgi:hypothetical protein